MDHQITASDRSCFDGGTWGLIGTRLLALLLTVVTLGIGTPWAECMVMRWEARHTVISGRRMKFTGKGLDLLGRYLLWFLLCVITLGIYGFWFPVQREKWRVGHMVYEDDDSGYCSCFTGTVGGWFVNSLISDLMTIFTLGIGYAWAQKRFMKWRLAHTEIGGSRLVFVGTGGQLFVKNLLFILLTPLTLGIYAIFYPVILLKWEKLHTLALYRAPHIRSTSLAHEESAIRDAASFRIAASDLELNLLRQGIRGNDPMSKLEQMANGGSAYAKYQIARQQKGNAQSDSGISLALLKEAADGGLPHAQYDLALTLGPGDAARYVSLMAQSAQGGNMNAPVALKTHYEHRAMAEHAKDPAASVATLQRAAYWFKVAIEQKHPWAVSHQGDYVALVDRIALWQSQLQRQETVGGFALFVAFLGAFLIVVAVLMGAAMLLEKVFEEPADTDQTAYPYPGYFDPESGTFIPSVSVPDGMTVWYIYDQNGNIISAGVRGEEQKDTTPAETTLPEESPAPTSQARPDPTTATEKEPSAGTEIDDAILGSWCYAYYIDKGWIVLRKYHFYLDGTYFQRTVEFCNSDMYTAYGEVNEDGWFMTPIGPTERSGTYVLENGNALVLDGTRRYTISIHGAQMEMASGNGWPEVYHYGDGSDWTCVRDICEMKVD